MKTSLILIKHNLTKQMRSYQFLVTITIAIFLGFLCVPSKLAGYEIFYLGGVRGIYNSAWLGAMGALLSSILLWLPGFYLLRTQISEDKRYKIGQIVASTPMSKLQYIAGKAASNFVTLMVLELLFLMALAVMQMVRQESTDLILFQYIKPLLFLTIPYLLVLSSLTVLFDVISGLKGVLGNMVIFVLWITLASLSVAIPNNNFDLFGIGIVLSEMMQGAKIYYPNISMNGGSFGYYSVKSSTLTFPWDGIVFDSSFLISRLVWIAVSIAIILVSALIFNRFRESAKLSLTEIPKKKYKKEKLSTCGIENMIILSPIQRKKKTKLLPLIKGECQIMIGAMSVWWYLAVIAAILLCLILPQAQLMKGAAFIMLLPISSLPDMGVLLRVRVPNTPR